MEINQSVNCSYCCTVFADSKDSLQRCSQKNFEIYIKYLGSVFQSPSSNFEGELNLPLLCSNCFEASENLTKISHDLELLQQKLNEAVKSFAKYIVVCRKSVGVIDPQVEWVEQFDGCWKVEDHDLGNHFLLSSGGDMDCLPTMGTNDKEYEDNYRYYGHMENVSQTGMHSSDNFLTEGPMLTDILTNFLDVDIQETIPVIPPKIKLPKKKLSYTTMTPDPLDPAKSVIKADLLVIVERLHLDIKGKPTGLHFWPPHIQRIRPKLKKKRIRNRAKTNNLSRNAAKPKTPIPPTVHIIHNKVAASIKQNGVGLKEHSTSHSPDKYRFKCDWDGCNYVCDQQCRMVRHRRVHTGEKPFSCAKCGLKFSRSDYLHTHVKTHPS